MFEAEVWQRHAGFSCNTENGAKQGRTEDQVVSEKASVKFKPTGCILKYSLESSYNSGAFRLHPLSAKALAQTLWPLWIIKAR